MHFRTKLKNKKSQTFFWFIRILVIFGIFITVHIVTSNILLGMVHTFGIEYDVLMTNILDSVSYKDPATGRTYPHVIDLSKFNKEILDEALSGAHGATAKLTLTSNIANKSVYYDKESYELFFPLLGFEGKEVIKTYDFFLFDIEKKNIFKYGNTMYKLVPRSFIVHVADETGKIHRQPVRLQANIIFAVETKEYT